MAVLSLKSPELAPVINRNLRGMGCSFAASIGFSIAHGLVRPIATEIHAFEIVFFRSVFGILTVAPWFMRSGLEPLRTKRLALHLLRVTIGVTSSLLFYWALATAPLAKVTALSFLGAIFGVLYAGLFLGEIVSVKRWSAISAGFAGTLIILRPGFAEIELGSLLALLAAAIWAFATILVKKLSSTESSVTITSYTVLFFSPAALLASLFFWEWPSWQVLGLLALMGVAATSSHLLFTQGLRDADANVVLPLDFLRLIWVAFIAYFFFAEIPSLFTWVGGVVILLSAMQIAYDERKSGKI